MKKLIIMMAAMAALVGCGDGGGTTTDPSEQYLDEYRAALVALDSLMDDHVEAVSQVTTVAEVKSLDDSLLADFTVLDTDIKGALTDLQACEPKNNNNNDAQVRLQKALTDMQFVRSMVQTHCQLQHSDMAPVMGEEEQMRDMVQTRLATMEQDRGQLRNQLHCD